MPPVLASISKSPASRSAFLFLGCGMARAVGWVAAEVVSPLPVGSDHGLVAAGERRRPPPDKPTIKIDWDLSSNS
jgi:hypothetical protein